jgi:hypothetical protein
MALSIAIAIIMAIAVAAVSAAAVHIPQVVSCYRTVLCGICTGRGSCQSVRK